MSCEALSQERAGLFMTERTGDFDGSAAVDYTVNCASGFPSLAGETGQPMRRSSKPRLAGLRSDNSGSAKLAVGVHASYIFSGNAGSRHGWNAGPRPGMEHG